MTGIVISYVDCWRFKAATDSKVIPG